MWVRDIDIVASPGAPTQRVRLQANVHFEQAELAPQTLWFEVERTVAGELSESGNPWAVLLLPVAVNAQERLEISRPVDRVLHAQLAEVMEIWRCWYPHARPVSIDAQLDDVPFPPGRRTAAFFSSGVDAWFTLLRHCAEDRSRDTAPIEDLITVWGLDVPLDRPDEFEQMRAVAVQAASRHGLEVVSVATNLHDTQWWCGSDWGHMGHGCALAAIGLALERRYAQVLIPSTHQYADLVPWGSHPLTDPLLGSSATRIVHDGAGFTRVEKTEWVTRSPLALSSLQVCWATRRFCNCAGCTKCYRTMATLELLGALERCQRFGHTQIDLHRLAKAYLPDASDLALMREVLALAHAKGRADVERAIRKSFRHTRRLAMALRAAHWLGTKRVVWRLREPLERTLMNGSLFE